MRNTLYHLLIQTRFKILLDLKSEYILALKLKVLKFERMALSEQNFRFLTQFNMNVGIMGDRSSLTWDS